MKTTKNRDRYVAYVSSYTSSMKDNFGIRIYDVDVEKGTLTEKDQVEITNSSYLTISHNQKYLYSITDFGVESYRILKGGDLEQINHAGHQRHARFLSFDRLHGPLAVRFGLPRRQGHGSEAAGRPDGSIGNDHGRGLSQGPGKHCGTQFPAACAVRQNDA
jgi:hypothetical protein